jgi:hypothetical protein
MFLISRYQYLLLGLCIVSPKSIIEVGLSRGIRAFQMIQFAKKYNSDIEYTGYDVFDTKDANWHKLVGNGKKVEAKSVIEKNLKVLTNNIQLVQGMTSETLWPHPNKADYVWLDGDHRLESIKKDFEALRESKVIVFDDYYPTGEHEGFHIDKYGCNKIIETLDENEIFITPKTKDIPNVRIVFWSKDILLINKIKDYLTNSDKIKQYLSL